MYVLLFDPQRRTETDPLLPSRLPSQNTFASEPRLPWDVLHLIFEEANPSTLAVLGAVSFDVLAATSKLLYRQPKLVDVEAVASLFSWRHDVRAAYTFLNPFLFSSVSLSP